MPSIASLLAMAVGLLAVSTPAFAQEISDSALVGRDISFTPETFQSGDLAKRWGKKDNRGHWCNRNSACHTHVWNARPSCSSHGYCTFKCLNGYVRRGNSCVRKHRRPQCWSSRDCPRKTGHSSSVCYYGRCEIKCNKGYHLEGSICKPNYNKCNDNTCYPVQDGFSTCYDGKCSYHCPTYLGYTLFTNKQQTAYRCVNLESDPQNCGEIGNVCPAGYNGKGWPVCQWGECDLDCAGFKKLHTSSGQPYCSSGW